MPIPSSGFDLSTLPIRQAIATWHEGINVVSEARLHQAPEARLAIRAQGFHFGDAALGTLETVPQDFKRSRARIGRDGIDSYTLHFFTRGHWGLYGGGSDQHVQPGDLLAVDQSEPYAAFMSAPATRYVALFVPRRLLAPLLKTPDDHNVRVIRSAAPLVSLLRHHLLTLYDELPNMSLAEARAVLRPTLELAAATLNGSVGEENARAVNGALAERIRRYIDDRILEPALSVEIIAAAFGISTRTLYHHFEPHGGVVAYMQRKRLRLAQTAITDPANRHRNIQDIAEEFGFLHRKNFISAFRREFGVTPREARAFASEGRPNGFAEPGTGRTVWDWIRDLR